MTGHERTGVLLMTYGSPASLDDVPRYLTAVRGGREPSADLVGEFTNRYRVIGGSPLVGITLAQARALEDHFGGDVIVRAAMRFSEPSIARGLRELSGLGVGRVIGIVMSPQYSPLLMGGYERDVLAARASLDGRAPDVEIAGPWHREPAFIEALAERIREGLDQFVVEERSRVPVLITAHSLPRRVADQEPDYLAQLRETAESVAARASLDSDRWTFCWQSAGHEPGEWMQPDLANVVASLRAAGHVSVLVAPVQFLADHLEILYDIDVGARQQAEAAGLQLSRIQSLNTSTKFIDALAAVVTRHMPSYPSAGNAAPGSTNATSALTEWTYVESRAARVGRERRGLQ